MKKKNNIGKFLAGASLGAGLALLFAPKNGSELRSDLKKKLDELINKAKEIDTEEVSNEFKKKVAELKKETEELDKEKVLEIAKEKGEKLKEKAEDLFELAKEKGTPVLVGISRDVKKSTANVIKEVLKKLESDTKEDK